MQLFVKVVTRHRFKLRNYVYLQQTTPTYFGCDDKTHHFASMGVATFQRTIFVEKTWLNLKDTFA